MKQKKIFSGNSFGGGGNFERTRRATCTYLLHTAAAEAVCFEKKLEKILGEVFVTVVKINSSIEKVELFG